MGWYSRSTSTRWYRSLPAHRTAAAAKATWRRKNIRKTPLTARVVTTRKLPRPIDPMMATAMPSSTTKVQGAPFGLCAGALESTASTGSSAAIAVSVELSVCAWFISGAET